jgi:hypothetical protein
VRKSSISVVLGGGLVTLAILLTVFIEKPQENLTANVEPKKRIEKNKKPRIDVLKKDELENNQIKIPSFDIVRVNIDGNTVMAGRAVPGSKVEIYDLEKKIGEVFADSRGEWVFVPKTHLTPGTRRFSLKMTSPDGLIKKSTSDLIVIVPERGKNIAGLESNEPSRSLAIRIPKKLGDRLEVLQKPSAETSIAFAIDTVDYDNSGKLNIAGKAPSESTINLYLNEKFIGRSVSNKRGIWYQTPKQAIKRGKYSLRADLIGKNGQVTSRVEVEFARSIPLSGIKPGALIVVESGRSLWRIARKTYGAGLRYTIIYEANKDQIKNPDMIFPGQVFSLPPNK